MVVMNVDSTPYSYLKVASIEHKGPICVMDAQCALCAWGARWISRHDKQYRFRIVPLQSGKGRLLMNHYRLDADDPASWLLLQAGIGYSASDAVIRTAGELGGVWRALVIFQLCPQRLLDGLYYFVARNRIRWFGRTDLCALPDPEIQKRLLD